MLCLIFHLHLLHCFFKLSIRTQTAAEVEEHANIAAMSAA